MKTNMQYQENTIEKITKTCRKSKGAVIKNYQNQNHLPFMKMTEGKVWQRLPWRHGIFGPNVGGPSWTWLWPGIPQSGMWFTFKCWYPSHSRQSYAFQQSLMMVEPGLIRSLIILRRVSPLLSFTETIKNALVPLQMGPTPTVFPHQGQENECHQCEEQIITLRSEHRFIGRHL